MAYTKPSTINSLWATSGDRTVVPTAKRSTGWVAEKPSYQYFNDILYKLGQANAYTNERGIAEWDSETTYLADKSYIVGSDGSLYQCRVGNSNQDPVLDDGSYWKLIANGQGVAAWNVLFDYNAGDLVLNDDELWLATDSSIGIEPTSSATEWDKIVRSADLGAAAYTNSATTSAEGTVELATQTEVDAGTDTSRVVTAATLASGVFEGLYPVGTIYSNTTNSANPSTYLLGASGSTWTAIEGRVIVGVGTVTDSRGVDTTFAASETGGETAHVQTEDELASHTHSNVPIRQSDTDRGDQSSLFSVDGVGTTSSTGNSDPMNILQPYQTAYVWVRTA